MHLNLFIAQAGFCSRRKAAALIKEGRVKVNGSLTREPWKEVNASDDITIDSKALSKSPDNEICILLNKPIGVTTTLQDRFAEKKVTDFIPKRFGRLYPVGRLDKDSRGLILLTNNGNLCYRLTHPKFEVEKEYKLTVRGTIHRGIETELKKGIVSEGELLKADSVTIIKAGPDKAEAVVIVKEGKKRHLRRLFRGVGLHVLDLKRVRVGTISLGPLREGAFRVLEQSEIESLLRASFKK